MYFILCDLYLMYTSICVNFILIVCNIYSILFYFGVFKLY